MTTFRQLPPRQRLLVIAGALVGVGILMVVASRGDQVFVVCAVVLFIAAVAMLVRAVGWRRAPARESSPTTTGQYARCGHMLRSMPQPLGDSAFWILTALAPGRLHGYAILLGVAESSADSVQLKPTTLYAVLDRLAGEGLVEADGDETVQGRTRRYFRLTDAGEQRLRSETARLEVRLEAARAGLRRLRPLGTQS